MELLYLEDSSVSYLATSCQQTALITPLNEICYSDLDEELALENSKGEEAQLPKSIKRVTSG